ncbi:hypothetical protein KTE26_02190 [Ralstonia mannitolilytica]|uniref:primase 1D-like protein n=1 Tax=Ralstonia mannitolilytica TaxID=105219 RepID=UPI0013159D16|nr:hypothetical protein [Ralstonia mannitolilytica]MBU9577243.1 hypothetical protein [Ralstonia mannitolilytica]
MNFDNHPLLIVDQIRKIYGEGCICTFSEYEYRPQSIVDNRRVFEVPISDVDRPWLRLNLTGLSSGAELALHSNIRWNGEVRHIPMIDFATRSRAQLPKLNEFLEGRIADSMLWFDSGRSFHGYGTTLITEAEWRELMGRLLLANMPNLPPLVDPRWVGHRLIAGYSALRWSCNTKQYIQLPELVHVT